MIRYSYTSGSFDRSVRRFLRKRPADGISAIATRNISSDATLESAIGEMEAVASRSRTEKPARTITLGWKTREFGDERMVKEVDWLFRENGSSECQRVYIVHGDGTDPHLHVIANDVDPVEGTKRNNCKISRHALHELERQHSDELEREPSPRERVYEEEGALHLRGMIEMSLKLNAEVASGERPKTEEPYGWFVQQEVSGILKRVAATNQATWEKMQRLLANRGFVLQGKPSGPGQVDTALKSEFVERRSTRFGKLGLRDVTETASDAEAILSMLSAS